MSLQMPTLRLYYVPFQELVCVIVIVWDTGERPPVYYDGGEDRVLDLQSMELHTFQCVSSFHPPHSTIHSIPGTAAGRYMYV